MQYLLWQVVGLSAAILWGTIWSVIIFGPMRIIKIVRPNPEVELKGMERTDPQYIALKRSVLLLSIANTVYSVHSYMFCAGLDVYDHGEQAYPPSAYVDGWQVL